MNHLYILHHTQHKQSDVSIHLESCLLNGYPRFALVLTAPEIHVWLFRC